MDSEIQAGESTSVLGQVCSLTSLSRSRFHLHRFRDGELVLPRAFVEEPIAHVWAAIETGLKKHS